MKSREKSKKPGKADYRSFNEAVSSIRSTAECKNFLSDLCTPAELESMVDRWRAVRLLKAGKTYREIAEATGISVTTVGRVARCLEMGSNGYVAIHERNNKKRSRREKDG